MSNSQYFWTILRVINWYIVYFSVYALRERNYIAKDQHLFLQWYQWMRITMRNSNDFFAKCSKDKFKFPAQTQGIWEKILTPTVYKSLKFLLTRHFEESQSILQPFFVNLEHWCPATVFHIWHFFGHNLIRVNHPLELCLQSLPFK